MTVINSEWSSAISLKVEDKAVPSNVVWEIQETQKFSKNYAGTLPHFGYAIAVNQAGDVAVVSNISSQGVLVGRVHHYVKVDGVWTYVYGFTAFDIGCSANITGGDGYFGASLALSGDGKSLLIGCTIGTPYFVHCAWENNAWVRKKEYKSRSSNPTDGFGTTISMSADGTTALVGTPFLHVNAKTAVGEVQVYNFDGTTWSYLKSIPATIIDTNRRFGSAVALSGDGNTAAITSQNLTDASTIEIFKRSGANWVLQRSVMFGDPDLLDPQDIMMPLYTNQTLESFARSLALNYKGNILYAGMTNDDDKANNAGALFIFAKIGEKWRTNTKFYPSDSAASDLFSYALATNGSGNLLLASAIYSDAVSSDAGAVYSFNMETYASGLAEVEVLAGTGTTGGTSYGQGVALDATGNTALITDPIYGSSDSGAAYFYKKENGNYSLLQKIVFPNSSVNLGNSAALSANGGIALIGGKETAEFYERSGDVWTKRATVTAADRISSDIFGAGAALSADGSLAAIGSYEDMSDSVRGAVYLFTRNGNDWIQSGKLVDPFTPKSHLFGQSVAMNADGTILFVTGRRYYTNAQTNSVPTIYVFVKNGEIWEYQKNFTAEFNSGGDLGFGYYVATNADASIVIFGMSTEKVNTKPIGGVHLFTRVDNSYTHRRRIYPFDKTDPIRFGPCAIAGDNSAMLVGMPDSGTPSTINGMAMLYINPAKF